MQKMQKNEVLMKNLQKDLHDRKILEADTPINGKPTDILKIEIIKIDGQNVHMGIFKLFSVSYTHLTLPTSDLV